MPRSHATILRLTPIKRCRASNRYRYRVTARETRREGILSISFVDHFIHRHEESLKRADLPSIQREPFGTCLCTLHSRTLSLDSSSGSSHFRIIRVLQTAGNFIPRAYYHIRRPSSELVGGQAPSARTLRRGEILVSLSSAAGFRAGTRGIPLRLPACRLPPAACRPAPPPASTGRAHTEIARHDRPGIDRGLIIAPASLPPTIFSVTQSSRPTAIADTASRGDRPRLSMALDSSTFHISEYSKREIDR